MNKVLYLFSQYYYYYYYYYYLLIKLSFAFQPEKFPWSGLQLVTKAINQEAHGSGHLKSQELFVVLLQFVVT